MPILFGVVLLDLIGFGIVIPILPFLSPQLGADKLDIAFIIITYAIGAGLCGPLWGRLSDRVGRKPVIMICLGGAALSYLLLALASALWMIYAARGFAGVMAGNLGVASAMMADITRPQNRARGMGIIGAAFGLGLVLGPVLGGLLSGDQASFTVPCLVAGGMSLLAIIAAALLLPESLSAAKRATILKQRGSGPRLSMHAMLRDSGSRLLVLQFLLHSTCASSVTYIFPLWAGDELAWGARQVGIVFGIQGGIMVVLQGLLLGPLVNTFGELRVLRVAVTALFLGLLCAVFATSMPTMVGSVFLAMSGATLCIPLLNAVISHRTPSAYRGRMMGTTSSASSWGRVAGPLLAGFSLSTFGYPGTWLGTALIAMVYCVLVYRE